MTDRNILGIFNKIVSNNIQTYGTIERKWINDNCFNTITFERMYERVCSLYEDKNDVAYNDKQRHATDRLFIHLYEKYYL